MKKLLPGNGTHRDSGFRRPLGILTEKGHRVGIDVLEFVLRAEHSHVTAEKGGLASNNVYNASFTGGSASVREWKTAETVTTWSSLST